MDVQVEQRKFKRFRVDDSAFAVFRPEFRKLGRIIDISWGGLCLEYLDQNNIHEEFSKAQIDILLSTGGFYMSEVSCEVIYDIQALKDQCTTGKIMGSGRCGIQFGELPEKLTEQLGDFLRNHVSGEWDSATDFRSNSTPLH